MFVIYTDFTINHALNENESCIIFECITYFFAQSDLSKYIFH